MKSSMHALLLIVLAAVGFHCSSPKQAAFRPKEVYTSKSLVISRISGHAYQHTSFKQTNDFGYVPCNGLVVVNGDAAVVFDTPTSDSGSAELIRWIRETLHCKVNAVIPTHFHDDCLGGLQAFHDQQIPSYAYVKTIELARENKYVVPVNGFSDSLVVPFGDASVSARFFGEGHTRDNVVGYFPGEQILFGGCLIKASGAGKGYLGDANVAAWSATVEHIRQAYPDVRIVVPGHGASGNGQLLDYTIDLFRKP